ncbi:MAG: hypothetical protein COB08_009245 [Rhodobacteraceae bacterium]|nr:hypothetical protein [Paracoccaceae bacterium]
MTHFSRNLPDHSWSETKKPYHTIIGMCIAGILAVVFLGTFVKATLDGDAVAPFILAGLIVFVGFELVGSDYLWNKKFSAYIKARPNDSICTFARAFDRHKVDPWIIRAVYNDLQFSLQKNGQNFPLRASDDLWNGLPIDPDEIEFDMWEALPPMVGRDMQNYESNPYFAKVQTVGDLVLFFNAQPLLPSHEYRRKLHWG